VSRIQINILKTIVGPILEFSKAKRDTGDPEGKDESEEGRHLEGATAKYPRACRLASARIREEQLA